MWLSLAIKIVPAVLSIIQWLIRRADERRLISDGERRAIARGLHEVALRVASAHKIEAEAAAAHARDTTDEAFDQDFQRHE